MFKKKWLTLLLVCINGVGFAVLPNPEDGWVDASLITITSSDSGEIYWNPPVNIIKGSGLSADLKHAANSNDLWTMHIDDGRYVDRHANPLVYDSTPSGIYRTDG